MAIREKAAARPTALLAWSSGKDSAWALHILRQRQQVDVVGLLTTVNEIDQRVAVHAVRAEVLDAQARAAGLPLWPVPIPAPCSNAIYEAAMGAAMERAAREGIQFIAFGDLFLDDIRRYREERLAPTGVRPLFPLWGLPTPTLACAMIHAGVRARVTCLDPRQLSPAFAGRDVDASFLADLPATVDPCGERGEFHTCAYDGPMFDHPLPLQTGATVLRDGFVVTDLTLPPSDAG